MKTALSIALLGMALAGCVSKPSDRYESPLLQKTVGTQAAPAIQSVNLTPSAPQAPDPERALANYKELLKLDPDPDTRADVLRHMADLEVQVADERGATDPKSEEEVRQAIETYKQILTDQPAAPKNDLILYQLAHAYQIVGDNADQLASLNRLGQDYPQSKYAVDAHFMIGEQYYLQNKFPQAEAEYAVVLAQDKGSPSQREQARYKYSFSLYNQGEYEEAIVSFFKLLDIEVPSNPPDTEAELIPSLPKEKVDFVRDGLQVVSEAFAKLGAAEGIEKYFGQHPEPAYSPLVYNALGDYLLQDRRYSDAAKVYATYIERHPLDARAPKFQIQVIAAFEEGGFIDASIPEKERYVSSYAPGTPYWSGRPTTPEVMTGLHKQVEDLAKYHHAKAQSSDPQMDPAARRQEFLTAADEYRKLLTIFPNDPDAAGTNMLLADALLDGGQTRAAAQEYDHTAYQYPQYVKAPDAAYASIQAYDRLSNEVPAGERPGIRRSVAQSGVKFANRYPNRPERYTVLTRSAEDFSAIGDRDDALKTAAQVLAANPPAAQPLRRSALAITADGQFAAANYPQAESADRALLTYLPENDPSRSAVVEQLAASIYKQGEAARSAGNFSEAALDFERVGQSAPGSSIHSNADFDAAAAYIQLKDWGHAENALEDFRTHYPTSSMAPEVDKKLAFAYQNDGKPLAAAAAYERISERPSESLEIRRDSAWTAAQMYDAARRPIEARQAYESYLQRFPEPLDRALDARSHLADLARASGNESGYLAMQKEIIAADDSGGTQRTDASRAMAARATLQVGLSQMRAADAVSLTLPLTRSVPAKKTATELAIQTFNSAAGYGFSDVATAATYQIGVLYQHFARALQDSDRPRNLSGEALSQYNLLLDEQVDPFVEKAISVHEINLQRIKTNQYDSWVAKSVDALGELEPAKYGKIEQKDTSYDRLQ